MDIRQIKDNTWLISANSYIGFYKINQRDIILLDTGLSHEQEALENILTSNNFNVKGAICTHGHSDHVGNLGFIKEKYKAISAMPKIEAEICGSIETLRSSYYNFTFQEISGFYGKNVVETDLLIGTKDESLEICGVEFKLINLPGHSQGMVGVITPDNVAFLGDALISENLFPGAKAPFSYRLGQDLESKEKLLSLDTCEKYILSHRGVYDEITGLVQNNLRFYEERAEVVYGLINRPMSWEEIMKSAFEDFNISVPLVVRKYKTIERCLRPYLDYLLETSRVAEEVTDGRIVYYRI